MCARRTPTVTHNTVCYERVSSTSSGISGTCAQLLWKPFHLQVIPTLLSLSFLNCKIIIILLHNVAVKKSNNPNDILTSSKSSPKFYYYYRCHYNYLNTQISMCLSPPLDSEPQKNRDHSWSLHPPSGPVEDSPTALRQGWNGSIQATWFNSAHYIVKTWPLLALTIIAC